MPVAASGHPAPSRPVRARAVATLSASAAIDGACSAYSAATDVRGTAR
ncbi:MULTISPECIES: hypothetical protein [Streptomyces]|nr:hypothetical protein [Streptomyces ruber]